MARILVVEDDLQISSLIVRMLQVQKHEVETAANGQEALDMLKQASFDLVLSDVRMPVMDGQVLLETMRVRGDQTPFIAMSGHACNHGDHAHIMADDFLPKPFSLDDLFEKVTQVLTQYAVV